jgi:hypothetical protein
LLAFWNPHSKICSILPFYLYSFSFIKKYVSLCKETCAVALLKTKFIACNPISKWAKEALKPKKL